MSINAEVVWRAISVFQNRVIPFNEASDLADVLGSREELLAWLLVRHGYLEHHPPVANRLTAIAQENARPSSASDRRAFVSSSKPDAHLQLEAALLTMLKAGVTSASVVDNVNTKRLEFLASSIGAQDPRIQRVISRPQPQSRFD